MIDLKRVEEDYKWVLAHPEEYGTTDAADAAVMRNVIALNLEMTRAEWVAWAVEHGFNKGSANNRYSETQKAWKEE